MVEPLLVDLVVLFDFTRRHACHTERTQVFYFLTNDGRQVDLLACSVAVETTAKTHRLSLVDRRMSTRVIAATRVYQHLVFLVQGRIELLGGTSNGHIFTLLLERRRLPCHIGMCRPLLYQSRRQLRPVNRGHNGTQNLLAHQLSVRDPIYTVLELAIEHATGYTCRRAPVHVSVARCTTRAGRHHRVRLQLLQVTVTLVKQVVEADLVVDYVRYLRPHLVRHQIVRVLYDTAALLVALVHFLHLGVENLADRRRHPVRSKVAVLLVRRILDSLQLELVLRAE